jgi:hypothetical protein
MPPTKRRRKDFCGGLEFREKAMSEIPSLSSLRFRGGPGQERATGVGSNMNLNIILLVLGCCYGNRCAKPQQRLRMGFDLTAGRDSVASYAETATCGYSGRGPFSAAQSVYGGPRAAAPAGPSDSWKQEIVVFHDGRTSFWKLPRPTSLPLG